MFNKVTLVGRISTDLELRYTGSNKAYCRFNLAVNRMNEVTDFIPVTVWGKPAENLVQYLFYLPNPVCDYTPRQ